MIPTFSLGQTGFGGSLAPPVTSYANLGGTGNRTAIITAITNITPDGGLVSFPASLLFNGVTSGANGWDLPGTGSTPIPTAPAAEIEFDFGSKVYIDEITLYFSNFPAMNGWAFGGRDTSGIGNALTLYMPSYNWNADTKIVAASVLPPPEGHRYWVKKFVGSGVNYTNNWFNEIEFKIAPGAT